MVSSNSDSEVLSENEATRLREAFERFRVPHTREVHKESLADLIQHLGYVVVAEQDVQRIADKVTRFAYLDFDEMLAVVSRCAAVEQELFAGLFSSHGRGQRAISVDGLMDVLTSHGFTPLRPVVLETLATVDIDGSGDLDFAEFRQFLQIFRTSEGFGKEEVAELRKAFSRFACDGGETLPNGFVDEALLHVFGLHAKEHIERLQHRGTRRPEAGLSFPCFIRRARQVREAELQLYREQLQNYSHSADGAISEEELRAALRGLDLVPRVEVVREVLDEVLSRQREGFARFGFDELATFMLLFRRREGFSQKELVELQELFTRYDEDHSGEISVLELDDVLRDLGYSTHDLDDVHVLVAKVDVDDSGALDFREFVHLMRLRREAELRRLRAAFEEHRVGDAASAVHAGGLWGVAGRLALATALTALGYEAPGDVSELRALATNETLSSEHAGDDAFFEQFVEIVDRSRALPGGMRRRRAGFSQAQLDDVEARFLSFVGDVAEQLPLARLEELLRDLRAPLEDADTDPRRLLALLDVARASARAAGVEDVGADGSTGVRLWEVVQLLRLLRKRRDRADEERLRAVAGEARFTWQEVRQFREVFVGRRQQERRSETGGLTLDDVRRLLRSLGVTMTHVQREALRSFVLTLFCGVPGDNEEEGEIDFEGFLKLMRWLLDSDFAGISGLLGQSDDADQTSAADMTVMTSSHHADEQPVPSEKAEATLDAPDERKPPSAESPEGLAGARTPSTRAPTPVSSPEPSPRVQDLEETLARVFAAIEKTGKGVDAKAFQKLCRDSGLLDSSFSVNDADLVFVAVGPKGFLGTGQSRRIDLPQFREALRRVAERKGVSLSVVWKAVAQHLPLPARSLGPPVRKSLSDNSQGRRPAPDPMTAISPIPSRNSPKSPRRGSKEMWGNLANWISAMPPSRGTAPRQVIATDAGALAGSPSRALLRSRSLGATEWGAATRTAPEPPPPVATRVPMRFRARSATGSVTLNVAHASSGSRPPANSSVPSAGSPQPVETSQLAVAFEKFCGAEHSMGCRGFELLCRHCLLINDSFSMTDCRRIFAESLPAGRRCLDFPHFETVLRLMAERKGVRESDVRCTVSMCAGNSTATTASRRELRRLSMGALAARSRRGSLSKLGTIS